MGKRDQYLAHLAEVPMFSACTKKELALIARHADELRYKDGQVLVNEGDAGVEFFILRTGKARVTRGRRELAALGAGDWFGELALLDKAPRNATVTAVGEIDVLVLSSQAFRGLLAEVPAMSWRLMTGLARRVHALDAHV